MTSGVIPALLSSSVPAVTLSRVGLLIGVPLTGVTALLTLVSTGFAVSDRKLSKTISKHEKTISLADHLVPIAVASKALSDG